MPLLLLTIPCYGSVTNEAYITKKLKKKKQQKKQLYIWSMFKFKCKNLINLTKLDANIVVTIKFNVLCIMFTNFERTQFQHMKWKKWKQYIYQSGACLPSLKKRPGLRRFFKDGRQTADWCIVFTFFRPANFWNTREMGEI